MNTHLGKDEDFSEEEEDEDEPGSTADKDEDEYNLRMFGISQALPVPDGPPVDLASGPPQTAEEYLQWVRQEAMQCASVVRADISPEKLMRSSAGAGVASTSGRPSHVARSQLMPDGPAWSQPSNSWTRQFLLDFRHLRQQLPVLAQQHRKELRTVKLPGVKELAAWDLICFGPGGDTAGNNSSQQNSGLSDGGQQSSDAAADTEQGRGGAASGSAAGVGIEQLSGPLLKTVLALDQVHVVTLLTWLIEELEDLPCLSYCRSQWLFALAACMEKPVHGDTGASFRSLMRKCCTLRSSLPQQHDPQLPALNTLIAIAGGYFGQDERLARLVADEELP